MRKGFKLKYTNGKVADPTAFPFKESQPGDSPAKGWFDKTMDAAKGMLGDMGVGPGSQDQQMQERWDDKNSGIAVSGGNANVNSRNKIIKENSLDEPIAPASR
jgi:hypothetical protein